MIVGVDDRVVEGMNVGMIEGMDDSGCAEVKIDGDSVDLTDGLIVVGEPTYIVYRVQVMRYNKVYQIFNPINNNII